jgi:hypothetical protein
MGGAATELNIEEGGTPTCRPEPHVGVLAPPSFEMKHTHIDDGSSLLSDFMVSNYGLECGS